MNDENEKPDQGGTDTGDQSARAGERLAEARRDGQLTVLEVAKELHLDELKVRALEKNEFESLGAPVFAKGHLRKYAQLVGVDEDDVLTDYYKLTRSQAIPPVVADRRRPGREFSPGPWIAVIVVLAVVALAYWILTRQPPPPAPVSSETAVEEPTPAEPMPAESIPDAGEQEPVDSDTAEPSAEPAVTEPTPADDMETEAADTGPSESAPAEEALGEPLADGGVRLTIEFLGDCWTEIFDATGRRLYYNMGREGQTVDVAGPGPLSVLFGDADNVTLAVNGEAFTIADADRSGRTARFALSGP